MTHTDQNNRLKKFANVLKSRELNALKHLERHFLSKTLRPFYNSKNDHNKDMKTLKLAKNRAYLFTITSLSRLLKYVGGTYDFKDKAQVESTRATYDEFLDYITSSKHILASDPEARIEYTNLFMRHFRKLGKKYRNDGNTKFNFVTFCCDAGITSEFNPEVDIAAYKDMVAACLNLYSNENAICVLEIQPLKEYSFSGKGGRKLMLHAHVITWGKGWTTKELKAFKMKCRRFKSTYTKYPIKRERIKGLTNNNLLRISSYLSKLPAHCKIQHKKVKIGRERPMAGYLMARHMEILSYIPLKSMIFGIGEGVQLKSQILKDLEKWNKDRSAFFKGRPVKTNEEKQKYWRQFWIEKRKAHYAHPVIKYKRAKKKAHSNLNFSETFINSKRTKRFCEAFFDKTSVTLVTGPGGAGKSTLLSYSKEIGQKLRTVTIAPTGIAALNVGGETFHSFTRKDTRFDPNNADFIPQKFKVNIFRRIDRVLIDEASMLTGFDIDYLDRCLRFLNNNHLKPFGGAKVIMFADYYQLSPIVSDELKAFMKRRKYKSQYSYDAKVFDEIDLRHLELKKVYRQNDREFIKHLNYIRKGINIQLAIDYFNDNCCGSINFENTPLVLCSHKDTVAGYNDTEFEQLKTPKVTYKANITGRIDEDAYPVDAKLTLAVGARVIAVKNSKKLGYKNGSLGTVIKCLKNSVIVKFDLLVDEVRVKAVRWEEVRHSDRNGKLTKETAGCFEQIPLQLGYAITIHKAQGLSLENVVIDLGSGAFAKGQLYVALSRARTIGGLWLTQEIEWSDVIYNKNITRSLNALIKFKWI